MWAPNSVVELNDMLEVTLDARGELIKLYSPTAPIQHKRVTLPATSIVEIMTDDSFSAFAIQPFVVAGKTYPA